jgi:putative DNA primase/helicase
MTDYTRDYTDNDSSHYDENGLPISGSGEEHSGQVRMAYRLAKAYRDELLHVHGLGWHYYDGKRWTHDDRGEAKRAVLDVLRTALAESINDKQLRSDVSRCESDSGINGVLGVAAALFEFAATVHDLDADPYVLNTANGTLDLRTRQLRPHDPRDRITKVTRGAHLPATDSAPWAEFLTRVLPDVDERAYLQRVIGQAVHGAVREHLFPVLIGTGANGKTTAYSAICHALGDYAAVVSPELLMTHDRGGGTGGPELMELLGARLVVGSETEDGRKLDQATMKRLTGGDPITARKLYQPPVTWQPSHQLIYVTNALPKVKGNDPAAWRRIRVVPFDVVIPPEDRDPALLERLALHLDAVLSWAIAGWFDYEDHGGMREPASVLRATSDYQTASDAVARFIRDACETGDYLYAPTRDLYTAWQDWARKDGAEDMTEKALAKELDRLGYNAVRTKTGMRRRGLRVRSDDDETLGGEGW